MSIDINNDKLMSAVVKESGMDKDAVRSATSASPEYQGSKQLGSESHDPGKLAWKST